MKYQVKEVAGLVIGDETPLAEFDSFFDAIDWQDEHPDLNTYIEAVNDSEHRPMLAEIPTTNSDEVTLECMALEVAAQQLDDYHPDDDGHPLF